MVGCLQYDTMLDVGSFYADTKAELVKLPDLVKHGSEELANMNEVNCGSNCICYEDGEVYFLTGRNKWEVYQGGSSGGGGGGGADWPDGYEDEDIDFDSWDDLPGSGSGSGGSGSSSSSGTGEDDGEEEDLDFSGY